MAISGRFALIVALVLVWNLAFNQVGSSQRAGEGAAFQSSDGSEAESTFPTSLDGKAWNYICPIPPLFPGISSIQVLECDIEYPEPDICGLRILKHIRMRLWPGQALAVEYRNLNSTAAQLSRLVLSAEHLDFHLLADPAVADPVAPEHSPVMLFLASGLCSDKAALTSCLEAAYAGTPLYRACPGCFGVGVVSELQGLQEGYGWFGSAAGTGDTSFFRSQLPEGTATLLYFLASMSSHAVKVTYGRTARVLYMPGTRVAIVPSANRTFVGVGRAEDQEQGDGLGGDTGGSGKGGSSSLPGPLASVAGSDGSANTSNATGGSGSGVDSGPEARVPGGPYGPPATPSAGGPAAEAGLRPGGNGAASGWSWPGRLLSMAAQCVGAVALMALCGQGLMETG